MFAEIVGAFRPEIRGFTDKFVGQLVDQVSDKMFDEGIRPGAEQVFDDAQARIQPWITQALSTTLDRTEVKEGEVFHLDLAALREEIKASEHELRKKEESAAAEKERVEEIREPVEHVE